MSTNIFSGIGIPSAYLNDVENVEFAKMLSMQNSKFIRDIVTEQSVLGTGYTELIRKIYIQRFGDPKKETEAYFKNLDINSVEASFPSPASLNMANLNDQLSNVVTLVDTLSDSIDIAAEDKDLASPIFKRRMIRKFIPNIDWNDIDGIVELVKQDVLKLKIKAKFKPTDSMPEDDAGAPPTDME